MFLPKVNKVHISVLTGDLLMFINGSALGWSSSEVVKLFNSSTTPFEDEITFEQLSWISSLMFLGAAIGPVFSGYLIDRVGRKPTILVLGLPFLASYLIMAYAKTVNLFYFARLLGGLGMGGSFATIPLYISELALKSERGGLVATFNVAISLGYVFSYALGPYVSVTFFNLVLSVFPAIFLVLFVVVGVECPYYYVMKNQDNLARSILENIRQDASVDDIEIELLNIKENIREVDQGTLFLLFKSKATIKALTIGTGLLVLQQLIGMNSILTYSQLIFEQSEADLTADLCSIIIGLVQFAASVVTPFIMDKFGRKSILTVTTVGMILCLVPFGVYNILKDQNKDVSSISFIPILTLTLVIILYTIGFGPIPWIIVGEIFPLKVKAAATFIVNFINWICGFITSKYFNFMIQILGMGESFLIFTCFCLLAILFVKFVVVETKGKSLEEIQHILSHPV